MERDRLVGLVRCIGPEASDHSSHDGLFSSGVPSNRLADANFAISARDVIRI